MKITIVLAALACCVPPMAPVNVASASEHRSRQVASEFQREHPCPSTGLPTGACPGCRKDHIVPLACGGPDTVQNLQWQTTADAKSQGRMGTQAVRSTIMRFGLYRTGQLFLPIMDSC
jgi:hypothetical protein